MELVSDIWNIIINYYFLLNWKDKFRNFMYGKSHSHPYGNDCHKLDFIGFLSLLNGFVHYEFMDDTWTLPVDSINKAPTISKYLKTQVDLSKYIPTCCNVGMLADAEEHKYVYVKCITCNIYWCRMCWFHHHLRSSPPNFKWNIKEQLDETNICKKCSQGYINNQWVVTQSSSSSFNI